MEKEQNTPTSSSKEPSPATESRQVVSTTSETDEAISADTPEAPMLKVVLASGSPRRKDLLKSAGVRFVVRIPEVDETLDDELKAKPEEAARTLAERKAGAVVQEILAEDPTGMLMVLGADTVVVCNGEMFGKPRNLSDAKHMLRRLQDNTHQVITAVSVWMIAAPEAADLSMGFRTFADTSSVTFHPLTDEEIADYLRKGESFDKAGAYAAQGAGADLIKNIDGSLDTVIGFPVERLLREFPDLVTFNINAQQ